MIKEEQERAELPHIKEEQEDTWSSEEEQLRGDWLRVQTRCVSPFLITCRF